MFKMQQGVIVVPDSVPEKICKFFTFKILKRFEKASPTRSV